MVAEIADKITSDLKKQKEVDIISLEIVLNNLMCPICLTVSSDYIK
jgi:hypothetical protein